MTKTPPGSVPEKRITVEDLRDKAQEIGKIAEEDVRAVSRRVTEQDVTTYIIAGALVVAVAVSFAYYMGTRRRCG